MPPDLLKYVTALLTGGAMLLGVGRYVGRIETRLQQLEDRAQRAEQRGRYYHGDYQPGESR